MLESSIDVQAQERYSPVDPVLCSVVRNVDSAIQLPQYQQQ